MTPKPLARLFSSARQLLNKAKLDLKRLENATILLHLAKTIPSRFVAKSGGRNRIGKTFVDYLRNGHGATTAAAFSARARPGLGVSIPVDWEQLPSITGGAQWTIATAMDHLKAQTVDPWRQYWTTRQTLGKAMKILKWQPA